MHKELIQPSSLGAMHISYQAFVIGGGPADNGVRLVDGGVFARGQHGDLLIVPVLFGEVCHWLPTRVQFRGTFWVSSTHHTESLGSYVMGIFLLHWHNMEHPLK